MVTKDIVGLAIDIGTSNIKAIVVDAHGGRLFASQLSCVTDRLNPGFSEQDATKIYESVRDVILSCPSEIKKEIAFICLSSAMHSVMAVDENGKPLTPLIIWSDLRSREESSSILSNKQLAGQLIQTGTPIHPMSPLCKIMWWRKNRPEIFKQAYKFIGIKEYIWFRLFQQYEVDQGIASATGILETGTLRWFGPALSLAGIDARQLSNPVSVYHTRELVNPSILNNFGFPKPVACVIGSSDGCLAHLGSNALDTDTLSLTIGTSGALRRAVKNGKVNLDGRIFRYHLDEETLIEGGATNNGAVLLEWFSKNFLKETVDINSFIERATKISIGADGLIFLPYVLGERAPLYNPDASGIFFGVRQHHNIEHFMRAILEGIGFALYSIAELVEADNRCSSMVASGGFARSEQWVQIIANIFGRPVRVDQYEHASALGAAIMGFKALGMDYIFSVGSLKVFEPSEINHIEYMKKFSTFKDLSARFSLGSNPYPTSIDHAKT